MYSNRFILIYSINRDSYFSASTVDSASLCLVLLFFLTSFSNLKFKRNHFIFLFILFSMEIIRDV